MTIGDGMIETRGVPEATSMLTQLGVRARRTTRDTSYKVRTIYRKSEQRRFSEQGPGWAELADSTKERKAREGLSAHTNVATGALVRSLTAVVASDQIDERTEEVMRFGSTVPYAPFVDARRKLIELTLSEQHEIGRAVSAYIARAQQ